MNTIIKYIKQIASSLLLVGMVFTSCTEDPNLWPVDNSHSRAFRPTDFGVKNIKSISATIGWNKVTGASEYLLEVSANADYSDPILSLKTTENVHDLTNLVGGVTYYARLSSVSNVEGVASSRSAELKFTTPTQQIMYSIRDGELTEDEVIVRWDPNGGSVNRVALVKVTDRNDSISYDLTPQEIESSSKTIAGLTKNTAYYVAIYLNNARRGFKIFSTQSDIQIVIPIAATQTTADVVTEMNAAIAQGKTDITLLFQNGTTYFESVDIQGTGTSITLPSGITKLRFTANDGTQPKLMITDLIFADSFKSVTYNNVWLFTSESSKYVFNSAAVGKFPEELYITNSTIEGYVGTLRTRVVTTYKVSYDNCIFKKIGSYALLYAGVASDNCKGFSLTNSTLIDCVVIVDGRNYTPSNDAPFEISNCTFYNGKDVNMTSLIRLSGNPSGGATIQKNIIAFGKDYTAQLLYSGSGYNGLDFSSSWITNNFTYTTGKTGFNGMNTFAGKDTDLFVAPDLGNFEFKSTVTGAIREAGDPRWYSK